MPIPRRGIASLRDTLVNNGSSPAERRIVKRRNALQRAKTHRKVRGWSDRRSIARRPFYAITEASTKAVLDLRSRSICQRNDCSVASLDCQHQFVAHQFGHPNVGSRHFLAAGMARSFVRSSRKRGPRMKRRKRMSLPSAGSFLSAAGRTAASITANTVAPLMERLGKTVARKPRRAPDEATWRISRDEITRQKAQDECEMFDAQRVNLPNDSFTHQWDDQPVDPAGGSR